MLSSLPFSPFPKAIGKFLWIELCSFYIQAPDQIAFSDDNSPGGKPQPLVLSLDSMLGTANSLVSIPCLFGILPQMPHWELLVAAAVLHLGGISLQSPSF